MLACPKYRRQERDGEGGRESGGERVKRDAHLGFELSFELRFRVCRIDPARPCPLVPYQWIAISICPSSLTPHTPSPSPSKWQVAIDNANAAHGNGIRNSQSALFMFISWGNCIAICIHKNI